MFGILRLQDNAAATPRNLVHGMRHTSSVIIPVTSGFDLQPLLDRSRACTKSNSHLAMSLQTEDASPCRGEGALTLTLPINGREVSCKTGGWSKDSEFERTRDDSDGSPLLLDMAPETSFASPDNKTIEPFVRWHQRCGAFGLFDGVYAGSNFVSVGVSFRI